MKLKEVSKSYDHITIDEVKNHLNININYTDDDSMLLGLIAVATESAENYTEVPIALTTKKASDINVNNDNVITINDNNLYGIDKITINGIEVTGFTTTENTNDFDIEFNNNVTGDIIVDYKVGFSSDTIKPVIKQAILIKLMSLYDVERSEYNISSYSVNNAFTSMLNYYKKLTLI